MSHEASTEETPVAQAPAQAVARPFPRTPRVLPPADAAERIREAASKGSRRAVARAMKVDRTTVNRWLEEHPELREAFDEGWLAQEQEYVDALRTVALDPKRGRDQVVALLFLLKARYGWREGDTVDGGQRSNVIINLPGAQSLDQYRGAIQGTATPVPPPRFSHD